MIERGHLEAMRTAANNAQLAATNGDSEAAIYASRQMSAISEILEYTKGVLAKYDVGDVKSPSIEPQKTWLKDTTIFSEREVSLLHTFASAEDNFVPDEIIYKMLTPNESISPKSKQKVQVILCRVRSKIKKQTGGSVTISRPKHKKGYQVVQKAPTNIN